jgi:hypothetical protein
MKCWYCNQMAPASVDGTRFGLVCPEPRVLAASQPPRRAPRPCSHVSTTRSISVCCSREANCRSRSISLPHEDRKCDWKCALPPTLRCLPKDVTIVDSSLASVAVYCSRRDPRAGSFKRQSGGCVFSSWPRCCQASVAAVGSRQTFSTLVHSSFASVADCCSRRDPRAGSFQRQSAGCALPKSCSHSSVSTFVGLVNGTSSNSTLS